MNEAEALLLADTTSLHTAIAWLQEHGPELIIITSGRQPTRILHQGAVHELPAFEVEVIYDVGAGDVFHAGFLAAWRPGDDPVPAAQFAAAAAAIKIGRPPQSEHMATREEALAFLRERGIDTTPLEHRA
jgi:sugar/nucleoside kinase (ribokinase family)